MADMPAFDAPPVPLEILIQRAQASAENKSTNKRNRALLKDMAVAIVSLARLNADLAAQLADKPRIIVP